MYRISDNRIVKWLLVGMAMAPAIFYALLGQFSRMMEDDFYHLRLGLEHGPWENVLYWRSRWNGAYGDYLLHGILGPLDTAVPSAFPIIIIAIWMLGLTWLLSQVMAFLKVWRYRKALAVSLAALTVAASVNAFYTPQSFYWFSSSARYTFPLALFTVYLALMLNAMRGRRSIARLALSALGGAFICFTSAGFSETYLVFQLAFISFLLVILFVFTTGALRWKVLALIGGGWLGTMASLAVQWTAPGRSIRAEALWLFPQFQPIRNLHDLGTHALYDTYHMVVNQETVVSFMLLFAVGMFVSLIVKPTSLPGIFSADHKFAGGKLPYFAGLIVQLIFIPILWTHSSNDAQFFGRFSVTFMAVVIMNMALIAAILLLIWRLPQIQAFLRREPKRLPVYVLIVMLVVLMLLAAPQMRDMHKNAVIFLVATALSMLAVAWWEWTSYLSDPWAKRLNLIALASTVLALLSVAALITVPRWFIGAGFPRHWSAAAFVLVTQGLVWGFAIGLSIKRQGESGQVRLQMASVVIFTIAYASIVISQVRLMPDFVVFAREWDDRHALLLELKKSGQKHIEIPPRAFDLEDFISGGVIVADDGFRKALLDYYEFDSITLTDDS